MDLNFSIGLRLNLTSGAIASAANGVLGAATLVTSHLISDDVVAEQPIRTNIVELAIIPLKTGKQLILSTSKVQSLIPVNNGTK